MADGPENNLPAPGTALEDLVYRSALAEGEGSIRGASPWLTVPVTVAVAGLFAGLAFVLGRQTETGRKVLQSVSVVLQEGPSAPVRAAAPGPAAAAPAPAPVPAAAPAPEIQPKAPPPPPPDPRQETVPDTAPRALPTEDHSRQYGSNAVAAAGSGGGTGAPGGAGGTSGGGAPGQVLDLDISALKVKFKPPEPAYPPLARTARIQGSVVVQILVGLDGVPASCLALSGPLQLRSAAVAYGLAWKFEPYLLNGKPMVSRFNLTVVYRLK